MSSCHIYSFFLMLFVTRGLSQTGTCPDPAKILPCTCQEGGYPPTDFDCDAVTSNDELASIFNQDFDATDFGRLNILGNNYLKTLRAGDLGQASFLEIWITSGALEVVESSALAGSYGTATKIMLFANNLVSFPFDELPIFTRLEALGLDYNNITALPVLVSDTLKFIGFQGNNLGPIPVDGLRQLTALDDASLRNCGLTYIQPGTFIGLPHLRYLDVAGNGLTVLSEGTFALNNNISVLIISYNNFQTIENNSFSGINSRLEAMADQLTVLEEEVWRPSLEAGAKLDIQSNRFQCGCDLAWLVRDPELMSLVDPETTCADGTLFIDLDPALFQDC